MTKAVLEQNLEELKALNKNLHEHNKSLTDLLKVEKEDNARLRKMEATYDIIFSNIAEAITPYIVESLASNEAFAQIIHDNAYEAAAEWGHNNYVQCGSDPYDE